MTEKVAVGVLSGAVKVSGFFTRSLANTKAGKKFFSLLPGEMVLATLDGFSKSRLLVSLCSDQFSGIYMFLSSLHAFLLFLPELLQVNK